MNRFTLLITLLMLTACPSSDTPTDSGAVPDAPVNDPGSLVDTRDDFVAPPDTNVDTGPTDTGTADTGPAAACPAEGDASGVCTREGLVCQYAPRSCPTTATCTAGAWVVLAPSCQAPSSCPATREEAAGSPCPGDENTGCDYPDNLLCTCTVCPNPYPICMPVDPAVWACEAPNPDAACPPGQPFLGSPCEMDAQECDYGCEPGRRRVCEDGVWVGGNAPGGCPMSTRRAKRDIEYLNDAQVDELAAAAMSTRLTTYEYTDPALDGRRRLGFIIEDQPASYAVDPERSQVDLYGYTSMLVAAMQAQERRIQALERELQTLRAD